MTDAQVKRVLQQRIKQAGDQRAAALRLGVSPSYLGDVLRGRRAPGPKILEALGLRRRRLGYEVGGK